MRLVDLRDANGSLSPDAEIIMMTYIHFPNDADAREELALLMKHQRARFRKVGAQSFSHSSISKTLTLAAKKPMQQKVVAGLAMLILQIIHRRDGSATKYAASKETSKFLKSQIRKGESPFFTRKLGERNEKIMIASATSRGAIEERLGWHNSISHFQAASLLLGSDSGQGFGWLEGVSPRFEGYLKTVEMFERETVERYPNYFPDVWRVSEGLPDYFKGVAPFDLTREFRAIFGINSLWEG